MNIVGLQNYPLAQRVLKMATPRLADVPKAEEYGPKNYTLDQLLYLQQNEIKQSHLIDCLKPDLSISGFHW